MDARRVLEQLTTPSLPLRVDERGIIRVGRTRIPLETVLIAFQQGYTPEEIAMQYPTLQLEDVYTIVTCYLHNREVLDAYLEVMERVGEENRRQWAMLHPARNLRQRLLKRYRRLQTQQQSDKAKE